MKTGSLSAKGPVGTGGVRPEEGVRPHHTGKGGPTLFSPSSEDDFKVGEMWSV